MSYMFSFSFKIGGNLFYRAAFSCFFFADYLFGADVDFPSPSLSSMPVPESQYVFQESCKDWKCRPCDIDPRITPLPGSADLMKHSMCSNLPCCPNKSKGKQEVGCYKLLVQVLFSSPPWKEDKSFCFEKDRAAELCQKARKKFTNETKCVFEMGGITKQMPDKEPIRNNETCYILQSHGGPGSLAVDLYTYCGPGSRDRCWEEAEKRNKGWGGMLSPHHGCSDRR